MEISDNHTVNAIFPSLCYRPPQKSARRRPRPSSTLTSLRRRARPCTRSRGARPRNVARSTAWRTERCGARNANGRKHVLDSWTKLLKRLRKTKVESKYCRIQTNNRKLGKCCY